MKKLLLSMFAALVSLAAMAQAPAFPGAEGFARYTTTGGRGGKVIHVTNLNDSGTGSLRQALESQSGARIIVFDVSGLIELKSDLNIKYGNVTVEGQTAPGDGICISNYTVNVKASNVILRFLRFRRGNAVNVNDGADTIWGRHLKNIILDHCSMSWSIDECASFYDNMNFTMQWCSLGESLNNAGHDKGAHGYGGIWGGRNATFHHNLLAHHTNRTPRLCGSRYGYWDTSEGCSLAGETYNATTYADGWSHSFDVELDEVRNCVMYNWGSGNGAYGGMGGHHNIINNYYKAGPSTKNTKRVFQCSKGTGSYALPAGVYGVFYINGNYVTAAGSAASYYDWKGVITDNTKSYTAIPDSIKSDVKFGDSPTTLHSAEVAYQKVLDYAGASYRKDTIDRRYAAEAASGTATFTGSVTNEKGIIDTQEDVGGWPTYVSKAALTDTDQDGMPDVWETANGLNPNDASDATTYTLDEKGYYTNIEVYCNSLVEDLIKAQNADAISAVDEYYPEINKAEGVDYYDGTPAEGTYATSTEPEGETTSTSYTISQSTYVSGDTEWVFNNGITITCSGKAYAKGNDDCIKFSAGKQATINLPSGVSIDSVEITGYDNYPELDSYLAELNGTNYAETDYVFPKCSLDDSGNKTDFQTVTHAIKMANAATNTLTLTFAVKQVCVKINLYGTTTVTGINALPASNGSARVVNTQYFNTAGQRINGSSTGIVIVKQQMSDGTIVTKKVKK